MADSTSTSRMANLRALNSKARTRIFIVGLGLLGMMVFGAMMVLSPSKKAAQGAASASLSSTPDVPAVPGASDSQNYTRLVEKTNQKQFQQAQVQGTTTLPTLTGPGDQGLTDPFATVTAPKPIQDTVPPPPPPAATPPANSAQSRPQESLPRANQVETADNSQAMTSAQKQFDLYVRSWQLPAPTSEFQHYGQQDTRKTAGAPGTEPGSATPVAQSSGGTSSAVAGSPAGQNSGPSFVRAGTVVPAVLITPINSDTPGPLLAEITAGPLQGARLIGHFTATESQVVVEFTTLSMVGQPRSFRVDAFAVNQETSSPGLATDVNHHYLKKYGLMAAAAFMGGYGQAVANQGTTTVVSPLGGATVTQGQLNSSQITKVALGNVGAKIGTQIDRTSGEVRPTIKVENGHGQGGVPIGLMFLSDF